MKEAKDTRCSRIRKAFKNFSMWNEMELKVQNGGEELHFIAFVTARLSLMTEPSLLLETFIY